MIKSSIIDSTMAASLKRLLQSAGLTPFAQNTFIDWPSLEQVATHFLHYVSPWLMVGQSNLAETTLRAAFSAYEQMLPHGYEASHRSFIERIAESANVLATLRVSVMNDDGLWAVWMYDEPLMTYLKRHNRWSIQIREREAPIASGPVMIKLLASISSTQDMQFADLDIPRLLNTKANP